MATDTSSQAAPTQDDDAQLDADFAAAFATDGAAAGDPKASGDAGAEPAKDGRAAAHEPQGQQGRSSEPLPDAQSGQPPTVEQLQAELEQRRQAERMLSGRLSASDRRLNELQAQLAAQRQQQLDAQQRQQQATEEADDPDDPLKAAPDLARSVDKRVSKRVRDLEQKLADSTKQIEQLTQAVQSTRQQVAPLHETQYRQAIADTHAGLDEKFGAAWRQDVRSDAYAAWLDKQPPSIRDLAEKAVGLDESAKVLHLFYAETGVKRAAPEGAGAAAASSPAAPAQRAAAPAAAPAARFNPQPGTPGATRAVGLPSRPSLPQPAQDDEAALDAAFSAAFRG